MTTPRSHRDTEEAAAAIAGTAPGPSPVAIGLSTLAGVPADMSSYLWGPKDEEVTAEEEEPLSSTRTRGNDVRPGEATILTGSADHRLPSSAALPATDTGHHHHHHHRKHHKHHAKDSTKKKANKPGRQPGARFALAVLTLINLLNYVDRYVPSAVKDLIKEDLNLTDAQTSYPLTGMILVYMVFSPLFGWLADYQILGRRPLLTGAVVFWSAATAVAALSQDLLSLIALRSLVGVGEACYVVIATPMIADFFPSKERNVALGIFYLAIPLGAAMGYALGGILGQAFGWRAAFLFCGVPGLLVAFLVMLINDPPHGVNDEPHTAAEAANVGARTHRGDYKLIFTNSYFVLGLAGITANCFCLGALADWMPTFLVRYRDMELQHAGFVIGVATVAGGVGGLFLGASSSDYFKRKGVRNAYFLVSAAYTLPAAVFMAAAINFDSELGSSVLITLAQIFVWTFNSPISSTMINCLRPELRARGTGAQIFIQHILGDVISPPIIGAISDRTGSLKIALDILPAFILLSGAFWAYAAWRLPELPSTLKKQLRVREGAAEGELEEVVEWVHDDEKVSFFKVLCAKEQPNPEDEEERLEEVEEGERERGREGEGEGEVGIALIDQEERRSSSGKSPMVLA